MRRIVIMILSLISFVSFAYIIYVLGEYVYLKIKLGKIVKEVEEYSNLPYLNRQLESIKLEYERIQSIRESTKTPALVISEIINIFKKRGIEIVSVSQSSSEEDKKSTFIIDAKGKFKDIMLAFSEAENSFLPMNTIYVYVRGNSENLKVRMSIFIWNM